MAKDWLEDKATWLFDLAHNNLDEDAIVKGFLRHYVQQGQGIDDVQRDMHFRTHYGDLYLKAAMTSMFLHQRKQRVAEIPETKRLLSELKAPER